jgi:8-oxo-dGTP diphosphatase
MGATVSEHPPAPPQLATFTMVLLRSGDRYLMLQRSPHKYFAPCQWTGIGGRVEPEELDDLHGSALREVLEETALEPDQITNFVLRRALLQQRPEHPITVLLYFTGEIDTTATSTTEEGTLHWLSEEEIEGVDVIENTRLVIPLLINDMHDYPAGSNQVLTGAARFSLEGELNSIVWSP